MIESTKEILMEFLRMRLGNSQQVFDKFRALPNAIHEQGSCSEQFLYIRGARTNKVLLVAHADTYWDQHGEHPSDEPHTVEDDKEHGKLVSSQRGLGADDRAGCAILWLLRNSGHSLLITDGEEYGQKGSKWLKDCYPDHYDEINTIHQFVIEFDRKNARDFKCYKVGTPEFGKYIEKKTEFCENNDCGKTDIGILCKNICGVNLSIGYQNEHHATEHLTLADWEHTLNLTCKWLEHEELPRFNLPHS